MDTRETLLAELVANGVKHTPENIVAIGRDWTGRVVFLETGRLTPVASGLAHIIEEHGTEWEQRGICEEQIPDLILETLARGCIVGYQGVNHSSTKPPRPIFEAEHDGKVLHLAITVGSNGYIVGVNTRITLVVPEGEGDAKSD